MGSMYCCRIFVSSCTGAAMAIGNVDFSNDSCPQPQKKRSVLARCAADCFFFFFLAESFFLVGKQELLTLTSVCSHHGGIWLHLAPAVPLLCCRCPWQTCQEAEGRLFISLPTALPRVPDSCGGDEKQEKWDGR